MAKALTAARIRALSAAGRYRDPEGPRGLYLQISPTGTKSWLLRYEIDGRERFHGLGSLEDFTLKEARERARSARQLLADGIDPIEHKLAAADARRKDALVNIPFKQAVDKFYDLHSPSWRNAKARAQWRTSIRRYAAKLSERPVGAIDAAAINDALAPIWERVPATASRVRRRVERVLEWVREGQPLPAAAGSEQRHHKALPYPDAPEFMAELAAREGVAARALELLVLTASRTAEVLHATWDEFDLDAGLWTIPATRMKSGKQHRVPLCPRAVEILGSLPREADNPHAFVGARRGKPIAHNAMLELLQSMRSGCTCHGFRSTFRDWAAETTAYPNHVAEQALAHAIGSKVEAAYRRGDLFEKRVRLMADWGRYCAGSAPAGEVVPLRGAR